MVYSAVYTYEMSNVGYAGYEKHYIKWHDELGGSYGVEY